MAVLISSGAVVQIVSSHSHRRHQVEFRSGASFQRHGSPRRSCRNTRSRLPRADRGRPGSQGAGKPSLPSCSSGLLFVLEVHATGFRTGFPVLPGVSSLPAGDSLVVTLRAKYARWIPRSYCHQVRGGRSRHRRALKSGTPAPITGAMVTSPQFSPPVPYRPPPFL